MHLTLREARRAINAAALVHTVDGHAVNCAAAPITENPETRFAYSNWHDPVSGESFHYMFAEGDNQEVPFEGHCITLKAVDGTLVDLYLLVPMDILATV